MIIKRLLRAPVFLLCLVASHFAVAGSADISDTAGFNIAGGIVSVSIESIENNTATRTTGSLYVTIRLTEGSSVHSPGYNIAQAELESVGYAPRLKPGGRLTNISFDTAFVEPPSGSYFGHLIVSEYPSINTPLDSLTFTGMLNYQIQVNSGHSVVFGGSASYQVDDGRVRLEVDRIVNRSDYNTTRPLYLTLFFTRNADPFHLTGYTTARQPLNVINGTGRLGPRGSFTGVSVSTEFLLPPRNDYFVHMYVSESGALDSPLDIITFAAQAERDGSKIEEKNFRPLRVRKLEATQGTDPRGVYLSWESTRYANFYEITRSANSGSQGALIQSTSLSGHFLDTSAVAGRRYFYRIRACNIQSECSPYSSPVEGWRFSRPESGVIGSERALAIARLYAAAFDRFPEKGGLNFWIGNYEQGQTLESIASRFVASSEFEERYGQLSNSQFVDQLYLNILGRPADEAGARFWVDHLDNGISRAKVLAQLSESPENKNKTSDYSLEIDRENQWLFCDTGADDC